MVSSTANTNDKSHHIVAALIRHNSGQHNKVGTVQGFDDHKADPMDTRAKGFKSTSACNLKTDDQNFQDFRRNSLESLSPAPVNEIRSDLKIQRSGFFGGFHLRNRLESATRHKVDADTMLTTKRALAEKDEAMNRLLFQLKQRENAIKQLEEIVLLQQESMELHRKSSDQEPQEPKQAEGSTSMEEEEMQEVIDHLHKQLKERNETNASLTANVKKQQEQLESMREKVSSSKEDEGNKERLAEMKGIIQELQAKLMDKNNTNGALVRSAKMQSETIASLRNEMKTLRQHEAQLNQDSVEELRRKDEIIGQLRQELITISQAFHRAEDLGAEDEDSDDEYYNGSGMIGNQILDVVEEEEERSEASR